MKWRPPAESLIALLDDLAGDLPVERRKMFGCPSLFVAGQLFAGVHQESLLLRLDEADRAALQARSDEIAPFAPMGRPMREFLAIPEPVALDPGFVAPWFERALAYARANPKTKAQLRARPAAPAKRPARRPRGA